MTVTSVIAGSTVYVVFFEIFGIRVSIGALVVAISITLGNWLQAFPAEMSSASTLDVRAAEHFSHTGTAFWATLNFPLLQLLL